MLAVLKRRNAPNQELLEGAWPHCIRLGRGTLKIRRDSVRIHSRSYGLLGREHYEVCMPLSRLLSVRRFDGNFCSFKNGAGAKDIQPAATVRMVSYHLHFIFTFKPVTSRCRFYNGAFVGAWDLPMTQRWLA
jgi:hypothetical protein